MTEVQLIYTGRSREPPVESLELPPPVYERHRDPRDYEAGEGLVRAVNVALLLGQPLLLTGAPGTGKTQLAHALAHALRLGVRETLVDAGDNVTIWRPVECWVKSTSGSRDLLYETDDLARFRDSQMRIPRAPEAYLRLNGLGKAILFAGGPDADLELMPGRLWEPPPVSEATLPGAIPIALFDRPTKAHQLLPRNSFPSPTGPARVVLLIDELDKAPRDTPNDLLNEIERMEFEIPELGVRVRGSQAYRPVVIITSNSEKSLPDPFLRRCVYYDIPQPGPDELRRIVFCRITSLKDESKRGDGTQKLGLVEEALELYTLLRTTLRRPPGTAELLAGLQLLVSDARLGPSDSIKGNEAAARRFLAVFAKNMDDQKRAEAELVTWAGWREATAASAKVAAL